MQQAREREMGDSNELLAVLEEARHYFAEDSTDIDACPVCGRPERRDRLVQRVDQELQRLSALKQVRDEWAESVKAVERAEGVLDEARRHLRGCAEHFVDALNRSPASVAAGFGELADLLAKAQGTTVRHVASAIDTAMPYRVTLTALIDEDQKTINQLSAIKTYVQTLTTSDRAMRELQRLAIRMTRILEVVEDERKRFVSELMDRIAQSVDELYGRMHPNESLGRPRFHVKAQAAGSLEMKANFGNKADVPPTAYYSEAHLDTLGLCVYLALAKHSTGGNALLVLDDVLTSVDDVHLDRIIDLIVEESVHFGQLIITTHSRAWFDRVRMAKAMSADLIELYGWDMQNGIRHSRSPLMVDELRVAVAAPRLDRQAVASKAGVLLEQLLDGLTLQYGCKLARKRDPAYTLNELANALDGKLLKLLKTEQTDSVGCVSQSTELKPLIEAATEFSWVRNQVGAHFNANAAGIADNMVRELDSAC